MKGRGGVDECCHWHLCAEKTPGNTSWLGQIGLGWASKASAKAEQFATWISHQRQASINDAGCCVYATLLQLHTPVPLLSYTTAHHTPKCLAAHTHTQSQPCSSHMTPNNHPPIPSPISPTKPLTIPPSPGAFLIEAVFQAAQAFYLSKISCCDL